MLKACCLSGFGFKFLQECRRILGESGQILGCPQLSHQASRVPGRTAGEAFTFEQYHIGQTKFTEVVGHTTADYATANNDDLRVRRKVHRQTLRFCPRPLQLIAMLSLIPVLISTIANGLKEVVRVAQEAMHLIKLPCVERHIKNARVVGPVLRNT